MRQLRGAAVLRGYGAAWLAAARNRFSLNTHRDWIDNGCILASFDQGNYNMGTC